MMVLGPLTYGPLLPRLHNSSPGPVSTGPSLLWVLHIYLHKLQDVYDPSEASHQDGEV